MMRHFFHSAAIQMSFLFLGTGQPILRLSLPIFTVLLQKIPIFCHKSVEQTRNVLLVSVCTVEMIPVRMLFLFHETTWWHFNRIFSRRLNHQRNSSWHVMTATSSAHHTPEMRLDAEKHQMTRLAPADVCVESASWLHESGADGGRSSTVKQHLNWGVICVVQLLSKKLFLCLHTITMHIIRMSKQSWQQLKTLYSAP